MGRLFDMIADGVMRNAITRGDVKFDPMDDDRLEQLIGHLAATPEGFANHMIYRSELLSVLLEVKRDREKPLHCPTCDGDHP